MSGHKFEIVPKHVRVLDIAKGTYADKFVGRVGKVVHADESSMLLVHFGPSNKLGDGRLDIEEQYLEEVSCPDS